MDRLVVLMQADQGERGVNVVVDEVVADVGIVEDQVGPR